MRMPPPSCAPDSKPAQSGGSDTGALSVNLSSDRVRVAMSLIEGIRNGHSLGALLGYQFELILHDDYTTVEMDQFIFHCAKRFPWLRMPWLPPRLRPTFPLKPSRRATW